MRLCRYNERKLGVVDGDQLCDVTAALDVLPALKWPLPMTDPLIGNLDVLLPRIAELLPGASRLPLASVRLNSPIANPPKVIGAPVNYLEHLSEAEQDKATFYEHQLIRIHEIGLFLKASTSVVGPGEGIRLRHQDRRTDHEVELVVIIGKRADRVQREVALDYVAGYTIGLDMTVRGKEERSLRKSIDSYTVLGPWMVTGDEIPNPDKLDMELRVNGERRQCANTSELVIDVPGLIAFASSYYTLHPGDVIMTGTPAGVGPVGPGDRITARIESIGMMELDVMAD